ncbi:MAG TPA: lanthionine synthetase LanC family protein, partial [Longimicrobium sp.]|nr:lanthionine synthetase LanC family protein [Longimicrobium sp.]
GAILALLALERVAPAAGAVEVAAACAHHLLRRSVSHQGRPRAWPGPGHPPLSGFAHGASGIACALLRLYARTGDEALRRAALEGLEYERGLFDAGAENWLDPRFGHLLEQSAWCHGAPGMVLARLEGVRAGAADAAVLGDLALTLKLTRALPLISLDHLCCGNLGRAEILLCAHRLLGDGELLADARALAARVVRRAAEGGGFALHPPGAEAAFSPGLFRGVAGIGYALLRLAHPETLPSPLLLE